MKTLFPALALSLTCLLNLSAQVEVTLDDFPFKEGDIREYATHEADVTSVAGWLGAPGGPQVWDFTTGPSDETYRYDIVRKEGSPYSDDFPDSELGEMLTIESSGEEGWTFYDVTKQGRAVDGFVDLIANPQFPLIIFDLPIIDYPGVIRFGDEWETRTSFPTNLVVLGIVLDVDVNANSTAHVDAYGTMVLPNRGTVDVLRINEVTSLASIADVQGSPVQLDTAFVRTYTWVAPGLGIVAQITSEGGTAEPVPIFSTAARFLRLSEIRLSPRLTDLNLQITRQGQDVMLNWNAAAGVDSYQIFTTNSLAGGSWGLWLTVAGTTAQDTIVPGARFYSVLPVGSPP